MTSWIQSRLLSHAAESIMWIIKHELHRNILVQLHTVLIKCRHPGVSHLCCWYFCLYFFTHFPPSKPECGGAVVILWSVFWRVFLRLSGLTSTVPLSNVLWINSNARFFRNSNCVIFNYPKYLIARYAFTSETAKINTKTQFSHLVVFHVSSKLNPCYLTVLYASDWIQSLRSNSVENVFIRYH